MTARILSLFVSYFVMNHKHTTQEKQCKEDDVLEKLEIFIFIHQEFLWYEKCLTFLFIFKTNMEFFLFFGNSKYNLMTLKEIAYLIVIIIQNNVTWLTHIFNLYQFNVSFKSFSFPTNIGLAQKHKRSSDLKVRKPF